MSQIFKYKKNFGIHYKNPGIIFIKIKLPEPLSDDIYNLISVIEKKYLNYTFHNKYKNFITLQLKHDEHHSYNEVSKTNNNYLKSFFQRNKNYILVKIEEKKFIKKYKNGYIPNDVNIFYKCLVTNQNLPEFKEIWWVNKEDLCLFEENIQKKIIENFWKKQKNKNIKKIEDWKDKFYKT